MLIMIPVLVFLSASTDSVPPSPPPPSKVQGLISGADYPGFAIDHGEEGSVVFEALVAPDGKVDNCKVLISSQSRTLDTATCLIVKTRARFAPAADANNKPTYGVSRAVITWSLGHALPVKLEPELELTINQAPAGAKMPVDFTVAYVSKRDGRIANCRLSDNQAAVPAVIWGLACQSLEGQRGEIVVDHAGKPVEAMNNTMVRISVKP